MLVSKRELTDDPVVHRMIEALSESGMPEKSLIEKLGMAHGTFTSWKYGRVKSYQVHINEMAEILNVSPNFLLRGTDDEVGVETLSEAEIRLIKGYRNADREGQRHILEMVGYVEMANIGSNKKGRRKG